MNYFKEVRNNKDYVVGKWRIQGINNNLKDKYFIPYFGIIVTGVRALLWKSKKISVIKL